MDDKFWEQVERARRMTPSERMSEGLRMRDAEVAQMLIDIRGEFPDATDEQVWEIRRVRLEEEQRRRSAEKDQILALIDAQNAAKRSQRTD
jgi:hypothetical protein